MRSSSVSVIIPNYNHASYLGGQLTALLSQTVRPLEIIVIDDGSTDDSIAVIERFAREEPIIRLIRNERNLGVVATLNRGLEAAQGEYFYGGAADDFVAPGFLESVQRMIDWHPEAGIYFGMYRAIDANDQEIRVEKSTRWQDNTYAPPERFLNEYLDVEHCTCSLSASTVYRKCCMEEAGGFRSELGHWCDTFMLRAIGLKYGAVYTPEVLVTMRRLPQGFSGAQGRNYRLMLDIIARAAWLMRSPPFRALFPEAHVARWQKEYTEFVIWGNLWARHEWLLAESRSPGPNRKPGWRELIHWPRRFGAQLLIRYYIRQMQSYVPDVSCYRTAAPAAEPVGTASPA